MIAWGNTTDRILLLLADEPMTKTEICRKLELTHDQVASVLSRLKKSKRIYIVDYTRHAVLNRTYLRPVYALGNKSDTTKVLRPYTQQERSKRSYNKLMATRNSSIFRLTLTNRELR